jgi:hypothetical protein
MITLFMEQGTVATIASEVRRTDWTTKRWTRHTGPYSRRAAEAHNFVRFAREFKKRPRGEWMTTRGIGRVVRKTQYGSVMT